jgi:hypothetical protein
MAIKEMAKQETASERFDRQIPASDRVVARTTARISSALDNMVRTLPDMHSPQLALEFVVRQLVPLQPWFMELLMESPDIKESYADEVSRIPARRPTSTTKGQRK